MNKLLNKKTAIELKFAKSDEQKAADKKAKDKAVIEKSKPDVAKKRSKNVPINVPVNVPVKYHGKFPNTHFFQRNSDYLNIFRI